MNNFENYEKFLEILDEDLAKIFDYQKEYICCQKGCSLCCERGDYPMSQLEFNYLKEEYNKLDDNLKKQINENIEKIKKENPDSYTCPYLTDHKCSVYSHRPFVCRAFGVLTEDSKGNPSFPFCSTLGLNFSKIYDKEKNHLSFALVKQNNYKIFPRIFRLSNKVLMNLPLVKEMGIEFGEVKKLKDFL